MLRYVLVGTALLFLGLFIVVPLAFILVEALKKGAGVYLAAITDPDDRRHQAHAANRGDSGALNSSFGIAAAWAIAKFAFPGKSVLTTLIDLPFSVSPVVSGLIYVLIFGLQGWFGGWLRDHDLKVIFAVPGIVLATIFVTFPFVARELIPLMQAQGTEQEEAATVLGATGWQTFARVTLPNIKWGLLYGVILCNARAMGEFGAVVRGIGPYSRSDQHAAACTWRSCTTNTSSRRRSPSRRCLRCWHSSRSRSNSLSSGVLEDWNVAGDLAETTARAVPSAN